MCTFSLEFDADKDEIIISDGEQSVMLEGGQMAKLRMLPPLPSAAR